MKIIEFFSDILRGIFGFFYGTDRAKETGNEAPTLKRSKLNRNAASFSNRETAADESFPTKQFRFRKTAPKAFWVFTVIEGIDRGRQFVGAAPELRIGRQAENHICLRDPKISRFHALIKLKDSHLIIKDLQSTNGTMINDTKIERSKLNSGDLIRMGDTVIRVTQEKR
ncbi:MAG: FHA domain-containing protein [Firmicutes bacterium]|nr:FHA domain-containing protein [Bacillota bacterium]